MFLFSSQLTHSIELHSMVKNNGVKVNYNGYPYSDGNQNDVLMMSQKNTSLQFVMHPS